jgi:hypothetical protein
MTKLTKRQRKKLKEREARKKEHENKVFQDAAKKKMVNIDETTLNEYHPSDVDINNPLVLEFYRYLKNQKVFGLFSKRYAFRKLTQREKSDALHSRDFIEIGNLTVTPDDSDFMKRIKVLRATIIPNVYDYGNWPNIRIHQVLGAYAKEYFKTKGVCNDKSEFYYQFMFGITSMVIAMFLMFGIIYYFWGKSILAVILLLLFIYSGFGIYKLCKFNIF